MTYSFIDLDGLPDLEGSSEKCRLKVVDADLGHIWLVEVDRLGRTYYQVLHETLVDGKWVEFRRYNA